jgi:hypothetical protein
VTARLLGAPLDLARLWHESTCCHSDDPHRAAAGRLRPAGRPVPAQTRCGGMGFGINPGHRCLREQQREQPADPSDICLVSRVAARTRCAAAPAVRATVSRASRRGRECAGLARRSGTQVARHQRPEVESAGHGRARDGRAMDARCTAPRSTLGAVPHAIRKALDHAVAMCKVMGASKSRAAP